MATPKNQAFVNSQVQWDSNSYYPGAFSASDIKAIFAFPDGVKKATVPIAGIKVSTHRDKFPVYSMPFINPRGFCQGHRTIAGTLMFNTIDRFAFHNILNEEVSRDGTYGGRVTGRVLPDQLPLFDIYLTYVNEQGMAAVASVLGVTLLDMSSAASLDDLQPMEVYSYMAMDYIPLSPLIKDTPPAFRINNINGERKSLNTGNGNSTFTLGRGNLSDENFGS